MRVKSTAARRHRKILKRAKGFKHSRSSRVRVAKETLLHSGAYAYHGRKLKKRDLRSIWITRISAASKAGGVSYSRLIKGLKDAKIEIDRKILADIAAFDKDTFVKIVKEAGFSFTAEK